jgi:DNA-binding MarR family transcriptional regulator
LPRITPGLVVEKKICPSDKRAADILITETGLEILEALSKKQKDIDGILTLSEEEANQLSDLLDKARS